MSDAICAVNAVPCEADVGGETGQDGSLGCSVVAVIIVCVCICVVVTQKADVGGGETGQDGSLGCSVVAVIMVCVSVRL